MSGARILVVDDEASIRRLLRASLTNYGYTVATAADGLEAIDQVTAWRPDLIVLDLGLPKLNGLDVCRSIRSWSRIPIIVLSVQDAERDKIQALDEGADDYLTKPFGMGELLARIRVALRHAAAAGPDAPLLVFGDLRLDLAARQVYVGEREIHLTPTEYDLLKLLASRAGKVLTHTLLLREIWGLSHERDTQTLRVFVAQLRRKLGDDPASPRYILTEPGVGYRFVAPGG
ncbi:MAG TPA: response regulator transcription factor [Roseiflexaceae bacterium]|nr:response regulator transcription factor [Roseiflexaceae bacterium]